jgi:hypothetical protein
LADHEARASVRRFLDLHPGGLLGVRASLVTRCGEPADERFGIEPQKDGHLTYAQLSPATQAASRPSALLRGCSNIETLCAGQDKLEVETATGQRQVEGGDGEMVRR